MWTAHAHNSFNVSALTVDTAINGPDRCCPGLLRCSRGTGCMPREGTHLWLYMWTAHAHNSFNVSILTVDMRCAGWPRRRTRAWTRCRRSWSPGTGSTRRAAPRRGPPSGACARSSLAGPYASLLRRPAASAAGGAPSAALRSGRGRPPHARGARICSDFDGWAERAPCVFSACRAAEADRRMREVRAARFNFIRSGEGA